MNIRSLAVFALCAACSDPGAPLTSGQQPIVNGELDPYDPGVVALTFNGSSFCTGTMVSPRVVVTAAHCVDGVTDFTRLRVQVGVRLGDGATILVIDGKVHEQYQGGSNDIALLLLDEPGPAIPWPVSTTPFDATFLGQNTRIAGYGATDPDGGGDGNKREGLSAISSFDSLDFEYTSNPSQTCFGDSGGPAFLTIDDVEYLIGVTSRGDSECAVRGIDTRVDVYADWVQFYIDIHDPTVPECGADGACAAGCAAPDPDCPCEADGFCSTDCEVLNHDRDCPKNCDHDGVCEVDEGGCPVDDLDCHPTGAVGDVCVFDSDCVAGACIGGVEDERATYCSDACGSDADCPGAMVCAADNMCRFDPPSPGAQGWPCTSDAQCVEGRCVDIDGDSFCANGCISDADCGDDLVCGRDPVTPTSKLCLPEDTGCGCRVGGRPGSDSTAILGLFLLFAGIIRKKIRPAGSVRAFRASRANRDSPLPRG